MVLALAGDSTITSDVDPAGAAGSRSSTTAVAERRLRAFVAVFFFAADRRAVFFAAGLAAAPRPATRRVTGSSTVSDSSSFPRGSRSSGRIFRGMLLSEPLRDRATGLLGHTQRPP